MFKPVVLTTAMAVTLTVALPVSAFDLKSMVDQAVGTATSGGASSNAAVAAALSDSEVIAGLKQALANGVRSAINRLGQTDGFLGNEMVRIAVPESLQSVASAARSFGAGRYVDEFETTMNRAAEQAVPEAADIFANAIEQMTIEDARGILGGENDAATQYFRRVAGDDLVDRFRPIVEQATNQTGVTAAYKGMVGQAGPLVGALGGSDVTDLDGYVTRGAVDGLFAMIGREEMRIRENPAARTTELLQKVFKY